MEKRQKSLTLSESNVELNRWSSMKILTIWVQLFGNRKHCTDMPKAKKCFVRSPKKKPNEVKEDLLKSNSSLLSKKSSGYLHKSTCSTFVNQQGLHSYTMYIYTNIFLYINILRYIFTRRASFVSNASKVRFYNVCFLPNLK